MRCYGHQPPFSLGFGFQGGFSLAHTMLAVVSGGMRQDVSGSAANDHDVAAGGAGAGGWRRGGGARARSHHRFVLPLIHSILYLLGDSPLILKRRCDRTLGGAPAARTVHLRAPACGVALGRRLALFDLI
jgi:hypothetical protein